MSKVAGGIHCTYTAYEAGKKLGYDAYERDLLSQYDIAQRKLVAYFNTCSTTAHMSICDRIFGEVGSLDLYYCLMLRSGNHYMGLDLQVEWLMDEGLGLDCDYARIGEHIARCVEWAFLVDGYGREVKAAAVGVAEVVRTIARAQNLERLFSPVELASAAAKVRISEFEFDQS
ncbi:hypothetical protein ACW9YV_15575 (plasmid) [Paraburkholderia strydomiana]|uniref:hypothetical protein n=1 Tax=Paraburkholderia strydomiana TaxID=1245417 RepID=UPI0038B909E5